MERDRKGGTPRTLSVEEWQVVRRMVHTTGGLWTYRLGGRFSPGADFHGIEALRSGSALYVRFEMIQSGLSLKRLQSVTTLSGLRYYLSCGQ